MADDPVFGSANELPVFAEVTLDVAAGACLSGLSALSALLEATGAGCGPLALAAEDWRRGSNCEIRSEKFVPVSDGAAFLPGMGNNESAGDSGVPAAGRLGGVIIWR
jgi:hypothetical protein